MRRKTGTPLPHNVFFRRIVRAMALAAGAGARPSACGPLAGFLKLLPPARAGGQQTADISFSSAEPGAVRFSVNDCGRRGVSGTRIGAWAAKLGAGYDLKALAGFLKLGGYLGADFQTTAALAWAAGREFPILKLYLEDSPGMAGAFRDAGFRQHVRSLAGLAALEMTGQAPEILAMDFSPDGATELKAYVRLDCLPAAGTCGAGRAAMRLLNMEHRCFYYEMLRFSSGGRKIYKVYEPGCAVNPAAGILEICGLFNRLGIAQGAGFAAVYGAMARRGGFRLVPSLCGVGLSACGKLKVDAYFRFAR